MKQSYSYIANVWSCPPYQDIFITLYNRALAPRNLFIGQFHKVQTSTYILGYIHIIIYGLLQQLHFYIMHCKNSYFFILLEMQVLSVTIHYLTEIQTYRLFKLEWGTSHENKFRQHDGTWNVDSRHLVSVIPLLKRKKYFHDITILPALFPLTTLKKLPTFTQFNKNIM